ncbi:MAG: TatD family hydrolase [Clostridia bacterium]|nr:TatD family hydrolase [Clostridia bacterium]MBQ3056846.1 TatD family hydrolase [Clostridia bacterium]
MEKMFDSHAHYYDDRFTRETGGTDALLQSLFATDVCGIINIGTDPENSRLVVREAAKWQGMYATVGIHPGDGQRLADIDTALFEIKEMLDGAREKKIVALGEIGLDYHYDDTDREKQAYFFEKQLELAEKYGMPVVIHDREAHGDCFDAVCRHPNVTGVFHSYSGSAEMARDLVRRGWYISFSGVVTFNNAPKVREAVAATPLDRILIETDAPYLAPVPHRGKLNHSGLMRYTAEAVAVVKGITTDELVRATCENAKCLFKI